MHRDNRCVYMAYGACLLLRLLYYCVGVCGNVCVGCRVDVEDSFFFYTWSVELCCIFV